MKIILEIFIMCRTQPFIEPFRAIVTLYNADAHAPIAMAGMPPDFPKQCRPDAASETCREAR